MNLTVVKGLGLVAFLVVAVGACSGSSSGGSGGPAPAQPVAAADYGYAMASAICETQARCGCEWDTATWGPCVNDRIGYYGSRVADLAAEGLVYDPECAGRRVQAIQATDCGLDAYYEDFVWDCGCSEFHGSVTEGQPCQRSLDMDDDFDNCAPGLTCSYASDVCVPACPGLGQRCEDGILCAEGSYCSDFTSGFCVPSPGLGEPCEWDCAAGARCGPEGVCIAAATVGPDGPCGESTLCRADLFCSDAGTCAVRLAAGAPCTGYGQCQTGLDCVDGVCGVDTEFVCLGSF